LYFVAADGAQHYDRQSPWTASAASLRLRRSMPAPPADDYYELLGVAAGADDAALHRAWRTLAARWHPDRAGQAATVTFQRIAAAYAVLSDPIARLAYDRRRRASGPPPNAAPRAATPSSAPTRPPAPAVMLSRLCRPLNLLQTNGAARLDEPGFITLTLREAEAAQGGMVTIPMRVEVWCPDCSNRDAPTACARCGGRRTTEELFSAWLAVPPGVTNGEVLAPSAELPGVVEHVRFRVQVAPPK
jgi:molecular chaperone DnaJ